MESTRNPIRPMEGSAEIFINRRRVVSYWLLMTILSIMVISFLSAKLSSSGRFDSGVFFAGAIVGLLAAIFVLIGLTNKMKGGAILENAVLIRFRPRKWVNLVGILTVIACLYVIYFLINEAELESFLFGFITVTPFVVLLGTLLLESKYGKVYVIY